MLARIRNQSTFAKIPFTPIFIGALVVLFFVILPLRAQLPAILDPVAGVRVDPRFDAHYDAIGGDEILGVTLTEAFSDDEGGIVVQYFQNGRLEFAEGELEVKTSPVSILLGAGESSLPSQPVGEGCQLFQETGHEVCHAFLDYYRLNGGPAVFGYPISKIKVERSQTVQYFQNFRLDWVQAEEGKGEIQIAALGKMLLEKQQSISDGPFAVEILPSVSLKYGVTRTSGEQIVYLLARNGEGKPLIGAEATLLAFFPDGKRTFILPATDANGRSQVVLNFENQPSGSSIRLEIVVFYESLRATTWDSFLVYGAN